MIDLIGVIVEEVEGNIVGGRFVVGNFERAHWISRVMELW